MNRSGGARRYFGPRARAWLGLLLGMAALILAGRSFDFAQVGAALRDVRPEWVVLTLITSLLTPVTKAVRWRWLFYPQRPKLSILRLTDLIVIGQAVNFFVPGRLGELVRAYLTGEEAALGKAFALGTIAAEKLLDLVMLAALAVGLLPFLTLPTWLAGRVESIVLTALLVTAGVGGLLGGRRFWLRGLNRLLHWLPAGRAATWQARVEAGLSGLAVLGNRTAAAAIWGWTMLFWAVAALSNLLLLLAFDLPPAPLMALVLLAVLQGGVAVPSTPGKIGVFHYLCILALSIFDVPGATALGYGLILHFLVVGGISAWAVAALWRRSWNLGRLLDASRTMN